MKHIGLTDGAVEKNVAKLLNDPEFIRESQKATEQVDEQVIKWFKARGLGYANRMHELTLNGDPRVSFQATKDVLDRIGTGPAQKIAMSGVDSYKALLKELQPEKKEEPSGKPADNGDQGGAAGHAADDGV
jgi:hypothetical protein